ncbi:acyltransferase [Schizopora paradoxa]|uniref:Acyltransferase n=1 Tax=Schizopora paradoxa TaxID=27342 RepID=A0A0H2R6T7_9AGAM|nr:acyltransferase [Schizopora paradoxa]
MPVKIVYRILRKISDWTLAGFYSEVSVEGQSNVPLGGPLLLTPCHHNEIIDIATLSVTVPHRRSISYWAKASMFANPLSRQIMFSAGALPVDRAKKNREAGSSSITSDSLKLHRSTFESLASEQAVAIFPEGTSYTEPRIVQVKEGAARVALEYAQWCRETSQGKNSTERIIIVPVGIVYTDKSTYRSRVAVEYGEPIVIDNYIDGFCSLDAEESRGAVRQLCGRIEERMKHLTINAPDWPSLYSSRMALDILRPEGSQVPLRNFRRISQRLVDIFTGTEIPEDVKASLLEYHALLSHAGLSHAELSVISSTTEVPIPTCSSVLVSLQWELFRAMLYFPLFSPALLAHVPAYILGSVSATKLAPKYVEARAQFKAIFGGIGIAIGCGSMGWGIWRWIKSSILDNSLGTNFSDYSFIQDVLGIFGLAWAMCLWHNRLIDANLKIYRRLRASLMVLRGLMRPVSSDITEERLAPYLTMPLPAFNPYVKNSSVSEEQRRNEVKAPRIPSSRLIRHILRARQDAMGKLSSVEDKLEQSFL